MVTSLASSTSSGLSESDEEVFEPLEWEVQYGNTVSQVSQEAQLLEAVREMFHQLQRDHGPPGPGLMQDLEGQEWNKQLNHVKSWVPRTCPSFIEFAVDPNADWNGLLKLVQSYLAQLELATYLEDNKERGCLLGLELNAPQSSKDTSMIVNWCNSGVLEFSEDLGQSIKEALMANLPDAAQVLVEEEIALARADMKRLSCSNAAQKLFEAKALLRLEHYKALVRNQKRAPGATVSPTKYLSPQTSTPRSGERQGPSVVATAAGQSRAPISNAPPINVARPEDHGRPQANPSKQKTKGCALL